MLSDRVVRFVCMTEIASSLTRAVARQYDLLQTSLERMGKERKFLNYGFTLTGDEPDDPIDERQQRLCLEVFKAADIGPDQLVVDVGFGSGEQDFLFARTSEFRQLIGFNISDRQVRYATDRARGEKLDCKLTFCLGQAELLPGIADASVGRLVAVEGAVYFDPPRLHRRPAQVVQPGGPLVAAAIPAPARLR